MTHQEAAEAAFAKARMLYTGKEADGTPISNLSGRYKSSNKLHLPTHSPYAGNEHLDWTDGLDEEDPSYSGKHMKALELHGTERIACRVEGKALDQGLVLRLSKTKALNCMELALISAEWAYRQLGNPNPAPIGLISLAHPADHIFCAVGPIVGLNAIEGVQVSRLAIAFSSANDVWAVDPWLNVCCNIQDYGNRAAAKFRKWLRSNKRVYWNDSPLGAGWHSPVGHYSDGFANATLNVQLV